MKNVLYKSTTGLDGLGKDLSQREKQILDLLVTGARVKDIAEKLFLSVKTVSTYRSRIMEKLGCKNILEVLRLATANGDSIARITYIGTVLVEQGDKPIEYLSELGRLHDFELIFKSVFNGDAIWYFNIQRQQRLKCVDRVANLVATLRNVNVRIIRYSLHETLMDSAHGDVFKILSEQAGEQT